MGKISRGQKILSDNKGTIDGEFVDNLAQGDCIYKTDDFIFEGFLVDEEKHGQGIEYDLVKGNKYIGEFTYGKRGPVGRLIFKDGKTEYEGEFKNDMIDGEGTLKNEDVTYTGSWKEDQMHGEGIYEWKDGRKYRGSYKHDLKSGFGIYHAADKVAYHGYWQEGLHHGEGTIVLANESMGKFQWHEGQKQDKLDLSQDEKLEVLSAVKESWGSLD